MAGFLPIFVLIDNITVKWMHSSGEENGFTSKIKPDMFLSENDRNRLNTIDSNVV